MGPLCASFNPHRIHGTGIFTFTCNTKIMPQLFWVIFVGQKSHLIPLQETSHVFTGFRGNASGFFASSRNKKSSSSSCLLKPRPNPRAPPCIGRFPPGPSFRRNRGGRNEGLKLPHLKGWWTSGCKDLCRGDVWMFPKIGVFPPKKDGL